MATHRFAHHCAPFVTDALDAVFASTATRATSSTSLLHDFQDSLRVAAAQWRALNTPDDVRSFLLQDDDDAWDAALDRFGGSPYDAAAGVRDALLDAARHVFTRPCIMLHSSSAVYSSRHELRDVVLAALSTADGYWVDDDGDDELVCVEPPDALRDIVLGPDPDDLRGSLPRRNE